MNLRWPFMLRSTHERAMRVAGAPLSISEGIAQGLGYVPPGALRFKEWYGEPTTKTALSDLERTFDPLRWPRRIEDRLSALEKAAGLEPAAAPRVEGDR